MPSFSPPEVEGHANVRGFVQTFFVFRGLFHVELFANLVLVKEE